jgi:hypothetical protein
MKKILAMAMAGLMIASFSVTGASAKKHRTHKSAHGMTTGMGSGPSTGMTGGNAALSGNNGNSGSGPNSVGHVQGGNIGAGK